MTYDSDSAIKTLKLTDEEKKYLCDPGVGWGGGVRPELLHDDVESPGPGDSHQLKGRQIHLLRETLANSLTYYLV